VVQGHAAPHMHHPHDAAKLKSSPHAHKVAVLLLLDIATMQRGECPT